MTPEERGVREEIRQRARHGGVQFLLQARQDIYDLLAVLAVTERERDELLLAERDAAGKEWLIADTLASYHAERERREAAEADAARLRGYLRGLPELVVCDVCELPDYTSPEDDPDLVMCTATELMGILESRVQGVLAAALAAQPGEG